MRLAGDLLMPSLYVPYVNMLVSLSNHPQAALHCFNLLKLNGIASGGHAAGKILKILIYSVYYSWLKGCS